MEHCREWVMVRHDDLIRLELLVTERRSLQAFDLVSEINRGVHERQYGHDEPLDTDHG